MTDTSTLRRLLHEACDLLDEVRSDESEDFIARVKIALDAHTAAQPAPAHIAAAACTCGNCGGLVCCQNCGTPSQPAPDVAAEAAKVLLAAHDVARRKPMAERTPYELQLSNLGRNRLIRLTKGHQP